MREAKWLELLTAEQTIDGSSRTLKSWLGCALTVHTAANGYLVATLGKLKAARKGTGHPTSLCRRLRISVLLAVTRPTYGIVHGTHPHRSDISCASGRLDCFAIFSNWPTWCHLHFVSCVQHMSLPTLYPSP